MNLPIKRGWIILGSILLLIILLNPGYNAFKEFTGLSGDNAAYLHKKANYLVFSVYENKDDDKTYAGFCMNFIDITPKQQETAAPSIPTPIVVNDASKVVDTSYTVPSADTVISNANRLKIPSKDPERKKEIMIICGVDRVFLKSVATDAIEAKTYINNKFLANEPMDLSKYINNIDSIKKGIQTVKEIQETKKLDKDFLSYLSLIEDFYKDTQRAYLEKDTDRLHKIGENLFDEVEPRFTKVVIDIGKLTGEYSNSGNDILFFNSDGLPVFKGKTQHY